jgi:hypothetical protein
MKIRFAQAAALALIAGLVPSIAVSQSAQQNHNQVWRPAATPQGGVAWSLLESTRLLDRRSNDGIIYTRPQFPQNVRALHGRQVRIAGYMMPLENAARQSHFVLLAYPPGCPFHMHAMPNQFVEVRASAPVPVQETRPMVLTGTLQLTGQDESGIFYRLVNARVG